MLDTHIVRVIILPQLMKIAWNMTRMGIGRKKQIHGDNWREMRTEREKHNGQETTYGQRKA